MTDAQLVARARRYVELKAQAAELEKRAHVDRDAVVVEMRRRGADVVEHGATRVKVTTRKTTTYDLDTLKARVPAGLLRKITRVVASKDLVQAQVSAGTLKAADAEAAARVSESVPFLKVTDLKAAA